MLILPVAAQTSLLNSWLKLALVTFVFNLSITAQTNVKQAVSNSNVQTQQRATNAQLAALRAYIKNSWTILRRSNKDLAKAAVDPKFERDGAPVKRTVYVPKSENLRVIENRLRREMSARDFQTIKLIRLPRDVLQIKEHGLLYLPHPYIVPGGRFNEMYGWDSYFIQVGLLRDGETQAAKDMTDNHLYQIENYGAVLNANRSYYLSRSQPPFLTQMITGVYAKTQNRLWLASTVPAMEKYYRFWTSPPHTVETNGLARYYDKGEGAAAEVVADERDEKGLTHYDRVREFYRQNKITDYDVTKFYNRERDELTPPFYKGDRSMRESGFDPSNRFGWFSTDIVSYYPVCLNSLLYVYERDAAEIMKILNRPNDARTWNARAVRRREQINRTLWDKDRDGLFYDYNFDTKQLRRYPFATTFYPLWAGIATKEQARRLVENLKLFEKDGGLLTSTDTSGSQWDAPYGWANLQLLAVEGLRRYGYTKEADRLSAKFLSMVLKEFIEHGNIVEKYDVVRRESDTEQGIKYGYSENVIGFGWTNAAFVEMYHQMTPARRADVLNVNAATDKSRKR